MNSIKVPVIAAIAAMTFSTPGLAAAVGFVVPAWLYPGNTTSAAAAPSPEAMAPIRLPGSSAAFTRAQVTDLFAAPDWYPERHPRMPEVVARGRKPAVYACSYCHLPDGQGRPENAPLAGLPAAYFAAQVGDFRSGARRSAWLRTWLPADFMRASAENVSDEEIAAAAEYYASLRLTRRVEIIETARVPKTRESGWLYVPIAGNNTEALEMRIIEVALDHERHELRDPVSGYRAYVPEGSIARGREIAERGRGEPALACVTCHGPDLRGVGLIPPLAGRSPTYILRQLLAFRSGTRSSPAGQPMMPVVQQLDMEDMIAAAAYAAALQP